LRKETTQNLIAILFPFDGEAKRRLPLPLSLVILGELFGIAPFLLVAVLASHLNALWGEEKQRISIARAIPKNASIIILDEAASSVEPEHALLAAIRELTHRKTISIAHRLMMVLDADQIPVVDGGKIAQTETHKEFAAKPGICRNFINLRSEVIGWQRS